MRFFWQYQKTAAPKHVNLCLLDDRKIQELHQTLLNLMAPVLLSYLKKWASQQNPRETENVVALYLTACTIAVVFSYLLDLDLCINIY